MGRGILQPGRCLRLAACLAAAAMLAGMSLRLDAQTSVRLEYYGDPLPEKDMEKIRKIISYEASFYSGFGIRDTVYMKLYVYEDKNDARILAERLAGKSLDLRYTGGMYFPKENTAIITGLKEQRERNIAVVCHEMSHHFVRKLMDDPPAWLNEGLSEYFEHCTAGRKGVSHSMTGYELGRIRSAYMLGEVDLKSFMQTPYSAFMHRQRTDEQYSYVMAHALVTFLIEEAPDSVLEGIVGAFRSRSSRPEDVAGLLDSIYPGGFPAFETDFREYVSE